MDLILNEFPFVFVSNIKKNRVEGSLWRFNTWIKDEKVFIFLIYNNVVGFVTILYLIIKSQSNAYIHDRLLQSTSKKAILWQQPTHKCTSMLLSSLSYSEQMLLLSLIGWEMDEKLVYSNMGYNGLNK